MELPDLLTEEGAQYLDNHFKDHSFVCGHSPSQGDTAVWTRLQCPPSPALENLSRWYRNIASYGTEIKSFPATDVKISFAKPDKSVAEVNSECLLKSLARLGFSLVPSGCSYYRLESTVLMSCDFLYISFYFCL